MSWFRYGYTVYQAEYSRNLLFRSGGQMEDLFDRVLDRTRSRLDIPALRTLFGLKNRPHCNRAAGPPAQEAVIEKSQYGLTSFKAPSGACSARPTPRASTSCASRLPSTTPKNCAAAADWITSPRSSPGWPGSPNGSPTILDCADISFIADGLLDELPLPSRLGSTRTGGIDLNKPRIRAALAAALTLAAAPHGFTVAQFTAQARQLGSNTGYTIRQGAYDLRKLCGEGLAAKLGATRRYHVPAAQARTIAALLAIRDQVIAPILAGVRSPRRGRKPAHWTLIDRDYETLRIGMQNLFHDLGITPVTAAA